MSVLDNGNQKFTWDYKHPLKSEDFNTLLRGQTEPGIYEGGDLTNVANDVTIAPFVAYLNFNGTLQGCVRVKTSIDAELEGITAGNNEVHYLIATITWANVDNNFLDFSTR